MTEILSMPWYEAKDLSLDPLSTLTMTYTIDGFEELKNDICKNGQLVPIILRDGNILDGRHRHKACMELGVDIKYKEMGLLSDDEALDLVISNSINKATGTDAAKVEAYLMSKTKGLKQKEMPELFSRLNIDYIKKMSFIEKENPEYLQALLKQNKVRLYNKEYDKVEDYGTIHGIWKTLKGNKILEDRVVEVVTESVKGPDYNVYISDVMNNSAAEQEYWEIYELGKDYGITVHPETLFGKKLIDLINGKYKDN